MMQRVIVLISVVVLLNACQISPNGMSMNLGIVGGSGGHLNVGTSLNIPVRFGTASHQATASPTIEESIITHFDAQGVPSEQAVKGGFYRQLLSKRNAEEYVVQDFYADGGKKRTDPMVLPKATLFEFRAHPVNGTLTVYAYNGNIMRQQTYQNNHLINAQ